MRFSKPTIHADLLNRIRGRLEGDIRPKSLHTGHVAGGTPPRSLPRVAKPKIVDQVRLKDVSLVDQRVLRRNRGAIRVGQKIGGIKNRVPVKTVAIIANCESVALPEGMVHSPNDLVKIVVLRF